MRRLVAIVDCQPGVGAVLSPPQGVGEGCLQTVQEVIQGWDAFLQAFALVCFGHHLAGMAGGVEGIPGQDLPVVKNTLGEGLTTCVGPQVSGEAKGFIHRQAGLYNKHGGASHLRLVKDMTLLPVQDLVDATSHLFQTLNLHKVDRLNKPGLGGQPPIIKAALGSGDDLAAPTVDGICMQGHIMDIEVHATHVFIAQSPLFGGPLEASYHTIFDLVEVLHTLGDISGDVGAGAIGPKHQIL